MPFNAPGQQTHSIAIADGWGGGRGAVVRKMRLHGIVNHPPPAKSIARSRRSPIRPGVGFPGRVRVFARSPQKLISPFVPPPRLILQSRKRRPQTASKPTGRCVDTARTWVWTSATRQCVATKPRVSLCHMTINAQPRRKPHPMFAHITPHPFPGPGAFSFLIDLLNDLNIVLDWGKVWWDPVCGSLRRKASDYSGFLNRGPRSRYPTP